MSHARAQDDGGYAITGTNFENVRAQVHPFERPRQQFGFHRPLPIPGVADPMVQQIHGALLLIDLHSLISSTNDLIVWRERPLHLRKHLTLLHHLDVAVIKAAQAQQDRDRAWNFDGRKLATRQATSPTWPLSALILRHPETQPALVPSVLAQPFL